MRDHIIDSMRYAADCKRENKTFNELCICLSQCQNYIQVVRIAEYFNRNKKKYTLIQVKFFVEMYEDKVQDIFKLSERV